MQTAENQRFVYQFDGFRLDPFDKTLYADEIPLHLPAKEFETLLLLVENNGRALSKEEMIRAVWHETFVEEGNLAKQISRLRKILDPGGGRYIETLPKHGYRFLADVERIMLPSDPTYFVKRTRQKLRIEVEEDLPAPWFRIAALAKSKVAGAAVLAVIGAALLLAFFIYRRADETEPAARINSIAVLPLRPAGRGEADIALAYGLTDALTTKLSGLRMFVVRPPAAVAKFSEPAADPLETGRQMAVDAVLEGSVQKTDERLRITIRLLSVAGGRQLWAADFDGETGKIFELEGLISEQTARALNFGGGPIPDRRLTRTYTENAAAFDAYLKGRYFWNKRTEEGFRQAVAYFEKAVAADPNYAPAYAGLADCYVLLGIWGALSPQEAMPRARAAAVKALAKDDSLAEPHVTLAFIGWVYDWDRTEAETQFHRAIEIDPNNATAHHWYAYYLASQERFDEAIVRIKTAQEIEGSLSIGISTDIGEIYCWAHQYDRTISQLEEVIRIDPGFAMARNTLGIVYLKKGRLTEAVTELETARRLDNNPRMMSVLGYAYGITGQKEKARKIIGELKEMSKKRYISAFSYAVVYIGLGEDETAVNLLEKAFDERSDTMAILGVYPLLDNLRSNPRFRNLQQRVLAAHPSKS